MVAIADDRERIARDLHDTVIQRLFGEGMNLQAALAGPDDRLRERLRSTVDGLDETIKELRMAIFSLQGAAGGAPGGLRGRLMAAATSATDGLGFEPRLQFDGPVETIDDPIAEQLIPVLREALANVARHAQARRVRVVVSVDSEVTMKVHDDGVGVPGEVIGGRGLTNLGERAARLGGSCTVRPGPTGGTELTWRCPGPRGTRLEVGRAGVIRRSRRATWGARPRGPPHARD